jgi:hypothetical protein
MSGKPKSNKRSAEWAEAGRRHRLSPSHVQMARELGMNPKKLGKLDNHRQEPWKAPLPQFIEDLYFKRFGAAAGSSKRAEAGAQVGEGDGLGGVGEREGVLAGVDEVEAVETK